MTAGPRPREGNVGIGRKALPHHDRFRDPEPVIGRLQTRFERRATSTAPLAFSGRFSKRPTRSFAAAASSGVRIATASCPSSRLATSAARSTPPSARRKHRPIEARRQGLARAVASREMPLASERAWRRRRHRADSDAPPAASTPAKGAAGRAAHKTMASETKIIRLTPGASRDPVKRSRELDDAKT